MKKLKNNNQAYGRLIGKYTKNYDRDSPETCCITIGNLDDTSAKWNYKSPNEPILLWDIYRDYIRKSQNAKKQTDTEIIQDIPSNLILKFSWLAILYLSCKLI